MVTDDAAPKHTEDNHGSRLEDFISQLEGVGLNAARLILSVTVTIAVFALVIDVIGLVIESVKYERATSETKYQISSISYKPQFSNVLVSGKPQTDPDNSLTEARVAAYSKTRDQLIADRLAYASEAGVCFGATNGQCPDMATQKNVMAQGWETAGISIRLPANSQVSYGNFPNPANLAPFYSDSGFSNAEDSLKAEWDAVNNCLGAYKQKNGNLYVQKAPELFGAVASQCDTDYTSALATELNSRPKDWSLLDTVQFMTMVWTLVGLGAAIITIALTIIFFRLEVSFRALRNLSRLK